MTDTANAPERIWAYPDYPDWSETGGWADHKDGWADSELLTEYVLSTHCDELVAAAYLNAGWRHIQTAPRDGSWFVACAVSPEFSVAKVVHFDDEHDRFPITGLRDEAWARAPTYWMPLPESAPAPDDARAALTAYGERMKDEGAREAQAKIARLTEALAIAGPIALKVFDYHLFTLDAEDQRKVETIRAALQENANG